VSRYTPPKNIRLPTSVRVPDLGDTSTLRARQDGVALMIGMLFKDATGSNEMMQETIGAIEGDGDRMLGVIGMLLNVFHAYATGNGADTLRWKALVDYLCTTIPDLPAPENN
jgi:hypothetical protein